MDILAWLSDKISKGENSELNDSIIQGILTGKTYVNSADATSFTTKGEQIIPYSELYTKTPESPTEITPVPASSYGSKVTNYRDGENWEILYEGAVEEGAESRIYLIKTDVTPPEELTYTSKYEGTNDFLDLSKLEDYPAIKQGLIYKTYKTLGADAGIKYSSSYINMKCTEYLLDSSLDKWKAFEDNHTEKFVDYVIGGPSFELIVASYNAVMKQNGNDNLVQSINNPTDYGYVKSDYFYNEDPLTNDGVTPWNHGSGYWMACPFNDQNSSTRGEYMHAILGVWIDNRLYSTAYGDYGRNPLGFRPVVCIKPGYYLEPHTADGVTTYTIEKNNF